MQSFVNTLSCRIFLALSIVVTAVGALKAGAQTTQVEPPVAMPLDSPQTAVDQYQAARKIAEANLANADDLDFNVFSNGRWDELKKSHAQDIKVYWPDGHLEVGIQKHIDSLKYYFTYAPDTRIKYHPVRIGTGEWTSWIGVMQGTFTKPMTTPDGRVIQPTGKAFSLPMCTVGHWKNGTMDAEYLFWDTGLYLKELGLQ